MALNLITIPLISLEPERIFSLIGLLFTPNRVQLQSNIIRVLIIVGLWDKKGVIKIVNR